jgi:chorismate mutase/prephenate dehydratase
MDENVERFRDEITRLDRAIFDAVNRRLELVAELKRYKAENGIAFLDPNRETEMIEERVAENAGPLSADGLRAFYKELLALVKEELR